MKVYTRLHDEKQILYNYATNTLLDRIYSKKLIPEIYLVASRRETNKFLNENFRTYLNCQVENHHKVNLKVCTNSPQDEKSLPAVDFISWAIFRKYQYGDDSYYHIIKNKIVEENSLFP